MGIERNAHRLGPMGVDDTTKPVMKRWHPCPGLPLRARDPRRAVGSLLGKAGQGRIRHPRRRLGIRSGRSERPERSPGGGHASRRRASAEEGREATSLAPRLATPRHTETLAKRGLACFSCCPLCTPVCSAWQNRQHERYKPNQTTTPSGPSCHGPSIVGGGSFDPGGRRSQGRA
jgi:hypothetical protein